MNKPTIGLLLRHADTVPFRDKPLLFIYLFTNTSHMKSSIKGFSFCTLCESGYTLDLSTFSFATELSFFGKFHQKNISSQIHFMFQQLTWNHFVLFPGNLGENGFYLRKLSQLSTCIHESMWAKQSVKIGDVLRYPHTIQEKLDIFFASSKKSPFLPVSRMEGL